MSICNVVELSSCRTIWFQLLENIFKGNFGWFKGKFQQLVEGSNIDIALKDYFSLVYFITSQ